MRKRDCGEKSYGSPIRHYMVELNNPVDYQDKEYLESLEALSTATTGAFRYIDLGSQAMTIVKPLKTAEKIFTENNRQAISLACLEAVKSKIASLAMGSFCLSPLADDDKKSLIQFKKKDGGYNLWLNFKQTEQQQKLLNLVAEMLVDMAKRVGKTVHEDDLELLGQENRIISMKMGCLAVDRTDDFLLSEIELGQQIDGYCPMFAIKEAYAYKKGSDLGVLKALDFFLGDTGVSTIRFNPFTLDLVKRNNKGGYYYA